MFFTGSLVLSILLAGTSQAEGIPSNVQEFYNSLKSKGSCDKKLATGFYNTDGGPSTFSYCGDHLSDDGVVYIQGTNGAFANMDIDCDGAKGTDGRCGSSTDIQDITAFQDTVASYGKGVHDLTADVHPYVVFGNLGSKYVQFDPTKYGVEPLSVMAVVCNNQLVFGIWGDENGDDGPRPMVGEASLSLATACFGEGMNGNNGHGPDDVLYIAFTGKDAVPGANGANWAAKSYDEFESSIVALGTKLIQRISGGSGGHSSKGGSSTSTSTSKTPHSVPPHIHTASSSAKSHSRGTGIPLSTGNPASVLTGIPIGLPTGFPSIHPMPPLSTGASIHTSRSHLPPPPPPPPPMSTGLSSSCSWIGHCLGATCQTYNDCSDDLVCTNGMCAEPEPPVVSSSSSSSSRNSSHIWHGPVVNARWVQPPHTTAWGTGAPKSHHHSLPTSHHPLSTGTHSHPHHPKHGNETSCSWKGHCLGAPCKTYNDCSDDLICIRDKCARPGHSSLPPPVLPVPPFRWTTFAKEVRKPVAATKTSAATPSIFSTTHPSPPKPTGHSEECSWKGHCVGDPCRTYNDCADPFVCWRGRCSEHGEPGSGPKGNYTFTAGTHSHSAHPTHGHPRPIILPRH